MSSEEAWNEGAPLGVESSAVGAAELCGSAPQETAGSGSARPRAVEPGGGGAGGDSHDSGDSRDSDESTRGDVVLFGVCAALGGLALGVIGTATQQLTVGQQSFGSVSGFPMGLLVSVVGVGCFVVGARLASRTRWNALIASICVIIPIAVLSLKSRGGSVLVPNNWVGQVWEYGPALLCLVAVLWPKLPPRPATTQPTPRPAE